MIPPNLLTPGINSTQSYPQTMTLAKGLFPWKRNLHLRTYSTPTPWLVQYCSDPPRAVDRLVCLFSCTPYEACLLIYLAGFTHVQIQFTRACPALPAKSTTHYNLRHIWRGEGEGNERGWGHGEGVIIKILGKQ